jgi:hypothetical protein
VAPDVISGEDCLFAALGSGRIVVLLSQGDVMINRSAVLASLHAVRFHFLGCAVGLRVCRCRFSVHTASPLVVIGSVFMGLC